MQRLIAIRSQGAGGPAYLRFSNDPVADTGPVDEDAEVVAVVPQTIVALAQVAQRVGLDLSPLFNQIAFSKAA